MKRRIGDYAMIGDCETAALVGREGSIEWLCLPRFDSSACFARLLGDDENGFWRIAPAKGVRRVSRRYVEDSLVLETIFETEDGVFSVTDFMPIRERTADLVRIVRGLEGSVDVVCDIALRFDYGRIKPWVRPVKDGFNAVAGPHGVVCRTSAPFEFNGKEEARFRIDKGGSISFVLSYFPSHENPPPALGADDALEQTLAFWRDWTGRCNYEGPYRDAVMRSLVVLKALTHAPTGGVVAAPTTSLPEKMTSGRNWDYRYCWLRDATFMLLAFLHAGYRDEARDWRAWLLRAVGGEASSLQPLYGVAGETHIIEWKAEWLSGFSGAGPVRIGNAAHEQFQLDVYGEILDVLHQAREHDITPSKESWRIQRELADYVAENWTKPDAGIWETRSGWRHFTQSKVMAWVALERCIRAAERYGFEGDIEGWRSTAKTIREEVMTRGYNEKLGSFTRELDSNDLDASLLLLPQVGFIEPTDPRMKGTVKAIRRDLMRDGYVLRYDSKESDDGLPPGEGVFLPCSCWLADAHMLQGEREKAEELFESVLAARNDLGLLSEEYDPQKNTLLGNFPQALTHVTLINTAFNLARAKGPAQARRGSTSQPMEAAHG